MKEKVAATYGSAAVIGMAITKVTTKGTQRGQKADRTECFVAVPRAASITFAVLPIVTGTILMLGATTSGFVWQDL